MSIESKFALWKRTGDTVRCESIEELEAVRQTILRYEPGSDLFCVQDRHWQLGFRDVGYIHQWVMWRPQVGKGHIPFAAWMDLVSDEPDVATDFQCDLSEVL